MAILPEMSAHGRMRQRIVAISRTRASRRRMARDRYLRSLVHSGAITSNDLDSAIDACSKALSEFTWLIKVDDAVLGRADRVFLVRHGRFPVDDNDFRLNGDYYRICRSLQYDPHYYDRSWSSCRRPWRPRRTASQGRPATLSSDLRTEAVSRREHDRKAGEHLGFRRRLDIGLITAPILATDHRAVLPVEARTAEAWAMGGVLAWPW